MKNIPYDLVRKIESELPEFVKGVHSNVDVIVMMLDAFAGEPELFYDAVWYATSHGKHVKIVAGKK